MQEEKMPTKKAAKRLRKAKSPSDGLPIEEYKNFVHWLEGFREMPGPLGLTADAAMSSIGAFTMLLGEASDNVRASGPKK
jgi:hypothetical protein